MTTTEAHNIIREALEAGTLTGDVLVQEQCRRSGGYPWGRMSHRDVEAVLGKIDRGIAAEIQETGRVNRSH